MTAIEKLAQEIAKNVYAAIHELDPGVGYFTDLITRHIAAALKERDEDTARLDWLIQEAMYEGTGPDRNRIIDDKNGVALVIGGGIEWPDGVRAAIDALRELGEGGSDD